MSARRRHRVRDRLGRFAPRRGRLTERLAGRLGPRGGRLTERLMGRLGPRGGRLAGRLERAARHALVVTVAALRSDLARRLGRLVLVAWALAVAVVLLYQHGDTPAALARPGQAGGMAGDVRAAPVAPGTSAARAATATPPTPAAPAGGAGPATPAGPKAAAPSPSTSAAPAGPKAAAPPAKPARPADVATAWYAARDHLPAGKVRALQQDVVSRREVRVLVLADRGNGKLDTALVTVRRDAAGRWRVP
jgi:hypothetical protein